MTIREALAEGSSLLSASGVDTPNLDASVLLAFVQQTDRARQLAQLADELDPPIVQRFRETIQKRAQGICVAYITGNKEFRGLQFVVNPGVLVPRPETEHLVEAALDFIDTRNQKIRVLDVCTGSGCVAIALRAERPTLQVAACDLSVEALEVARINAHALLDPESITFYRSDLLVAVPGEFNLIVSNPPYVPSALIDTLSPEVRAEPRMALDGGADGLALIRRLVDQAAQRLSMGGALFIEAGADQAFEVRSIFRSAGFLHVRSIRDLSGIERITGGQRP